MLLTTNLIIMIESIIALIIALTILGIVWLLFKWAIGMVALPAPLLQIGNIVFGVVAIIIVLRFLMKLL